MPASEIFDNPATELDEDNGLRACAPYLLGGCVIFVPRIKQITILTVLTPSCLLWDVEQDLPSTDPTHEHGLK